MPVSFKNDIAPIFAPFAPAMIWRLDLLNYDQVKANSSVIYGRISAPEIEVPMPPPPFPPLSSEQIALFKQWMDCDFPP